VRDVRGISGTWGRKEKLNIWGKRSAGVEGRCKLKSRRGGDFRSLKGGSERLLKESKEVAWGKGKNQIDGKKKRKHMNSLFWDKTGRVEKGWDEKGRMT